MQVDTNESTLIIGDHNTLFLRQDKLYRQEMCKYTELLSNKMKTVSLMDIYKIQSPSNSKQNSYFFEDTHATSIKIDHHNKY